MLTLNVYSTISKYVSKQKVMITLNDPDADNVKHCLSAALILYSDRQAFMVRSVYRIEFYIGFNSFSICVFYLEKQLNVPYSLVEHLPGDCLEGNCNN